MANRALGEKLSALVNNAGYGDKGGKERFRRLLAEKHAFHPGLQSILYWLSGERNPELTTLRVLLDALGVHGDERNQIVRLALPDGLLSDNRETDDGADNREAVDLPVQE